MATHDYTCPGCGATHTLYGIPAAIGARRAAPICPRCYGCRMDWAPATTAMDVGSVKTAAFTAIDIVDNRGRTVHVDSLHKLRQVERDSERMAADGIGSPFIWRDFSQDRSNRDRHTLTNQTPDQMADPHGTVARTEAALKKGRLEPGRGAPVIQAHGTVEAEG